MSFPQPPADLQRHLGAVVDAVCGAVAPCSTGEGGGTAAATVFHDSGCRASRLIRVSPSLPSNRTRGTDTTELCCSVQWLPFGDGVLVQIGRANGLGGGGQMVTTPTNLGSVLCELVPLLAISSEDSPAAWTEAYAEVLKRHPGIRRMSEYFRELSAPDTSRPQVSPQPVQPPQQHISFGVPASFANMSTSSRAVVTDPLAPAGGDGGFTRSGNVMQPNTQMMSQPPSSWIGPQHPIFGVSTTDGRFPPAFDPTFGASRFDPPFPNIGGGGARAGPFPGEPNADHLRPWNNDGEQSLRGDRGGFSARGRAAGRGFNQFY